MALETACACSNHTEGEAGLELVPWALFLAEVSSELMEAQRACAGLLLHGDPRVAMPPPRVGPDLSPSPAHSSILNLPGADAAAGLPEAPAGQQGASWRPCCGSSWNSSSGRTRSISVKLLAERQKRIEEQEGERLGKAGGGEGAPLAPGVPSWVPTVALGPLLRLQPVWSTHA